MARGVWIGVVCLTLAACGSNGNGAPEAEPRASTAGSSGPTKMANGEPAYGFGDAKDPETGYHATTILKCGFDGATPSQDCNAGVKRNWNGGGEHLVEVTKPDGRKRAIFFKGTEPYGADSAQADGSAAWELKSTRAGDQVTIEFGPERYIISDALLVGG